MILAREGRHLSELTNLERARVGLREHDVVPRWALECLRQLGELMDEQRKLLENVHDLKEAVEMLWLSSDEPGNAENNMENNAPRNAPKNVA